MERLLDNSGA